MNNKINSVTVAAFSILWLILSNIATFIYCTKSPDPHFSTVIPFFSTLHFLMGAFMFYTLTKNK